MKKLLLIVAVVLLLMFSVSASDIQTVSVEICPFYTEIQSASVYNGAVEYPLITYNNITYLPLTKGICDRLWLVTGFDSEKGFYIASSSFVPYIEDDRTIFGGSAVNYYGVPYSAVIPSYPIYLNGIRIDSTKEEYPFLNFRGITYMPLTYKYAVEELNFDFLFSSENRELKVYRKDSSGLIERQTDVTSYIDIGSDVENGFLINKVSNYHTSYTDEFGQKVYFPYHWHDTYLFNTSTGRAEHLERTEPFKESKSFIPREYPHKRPSCDEKLSFNGNTVYYDKAELMTFVPEKGREGSHIGSIYGYEFPWGDKSVIYIWLNIGFPGAPYTTSTYGYLFIKDGDRMTGVSEYDPYWGLLDIYTDGKHGAYICTASYSPSGFGRWTTQNSEVYYLGADGKLSALSERYPDINSLRAIGYADGKLYVKAMYYGYGKDVYTSHNPFSAVNSGYYVINSDHSITKLYSYVEGEAFLCNGIPYIFTSHSKIPRIVNLLTGVITEIE